MPVALLPPTTGSAVSLDVKALTTGPRFLRTQGMSRWHRPRSGSRHGDRDCYTAWCGYNIGSSDRARALTADEIPAGELVCATCEGRAIGAGQEEQQPGGRRLGFGPRELRPPKNCPGSRRAFLAPLPGGTTARCLVCGDTHPVRAMGGPYNPRFGLIQHPPGAALVEPCPFHRWRQLTITDRTVSCTCGRPTPAPAA
ncbi:hypothetical protein ACF06X_33620 [Streptomyces sp. NPDC015346]|uniref:hypothetical protein n=1 Tax=Streptomyces sp. NPDC015346 TaxID=3364954 RepID=UPI0036FF80E5